MVTIACPAASSLPAFRAESGASADTGVVSGPATRPAAAELTTTQQDVPKPGGLAARRIGGPLMASSGIVVNEPSDDPRPVPDIPASAWVIANANTGQVLAARDPHGEFGPASTLKVLTAVTLIPLLNPDAMVVATPLATSQQPTSAFLITGREYRVSDLFRALLLISANDAAVALTQATGSFARGMALINAEARHLQAYDVVAKLPNGLPAAGQVTSAYDEALIARQALAMPAFMKYDSTREARLELKPRDWETLVNQNYLLTQYRGGIGGKIGWTVKSEATYVGLARRNGVTLIATVLHCTSLQEITSAEQLLNWGFAMNGKVQPVGELVPPLPAPAPRSPLDARNAIKPKTVALATPQPAAGGTATGYALAAGGVVAAGLGLVALIRTRRRTLAGRRRPQLRGQRSPGDLAGPDRLGRIRVRRIRVRRIRVRRVSSAGPAAKHRNRLDARRGTGCRHLRPGGTRVGGCGLPPGAGRSVRDRHDREPAERQRSHEHDHHAKAGEETDLLKHRPGRAAHRGTGAGKTGPVTSDQVADSEPGTRECREPGREYSRRPEPAEQHDETACQRDDARQDLQPDPAGRGRPGTVRRVRIVEVRADERNQRAPDSE